MPGVGLGIGTKAPAGGGGWGGGLMRKVPERNETMPMGEGRVYGLGEKGALQDGGQVGRFAAGVGALPGKS